MQKPPPICQVFCHPAHIGNIPNLIFKALIKEHVGTQIWADFISIDCGLVGSKSRSFKTLIKEHVGTQIWADFISIDCGLVGSKCESPNLSARFPAIPGT